MSNDFSIRLRVDDETRVGVFATGLMVFSGPYEFVLDFTQNMEIPSRVVARVAVPHAALPNMLEIIRQGFGPQSSVSAAPPPLTFGGAGPQSSEEGGEGASAQTTDVPRNIYDDLKLPDGIQKGVHANALVTAHNDHIFRMDFVAQYCPDPVLTARVFLTKADAAGIRATLEHVAAGLQK